MNNLIGWSLTTACAVACLSLRAELVVDGDVPAGNIVIEGIEGDRVRLRPDLRDTRYDWFYWAFRVKGAKGRTLTFDFEKVYDGKVVGARGPAVTTDGGRTWSYPCDRDANAPAKSFAYTFATDDEVRFYETWQYLPDDWKSFLDAHVVQRGTALEEGVLCRTRKGADVPSLRVGCIKAAPKFRVFVSSRHHCSESTATAVVEGFVAQFLADDADGRWLRENVELMVVPFVDYDGAVAGDQGKGRRPHDHNRDYGDDAFIYPETKAIKAWIASHAGGRLDAFFDIHCPWLRGKKPGSTDEYVYAVLNAPGIQPSAENERRYSQLTEKLGGYDALRYRAAEDLPFGQKWNTAANYKDGQPAIIWAGRNVKGLKLLREFEVPFANANGAVVTPDACRAFGRAAARALKAFFAESPVPDA